MRRFPRPIQVYILLVIAAGAVVLFITLPQRIEKPELILFVTLSVFGVLAGMHPLPQAYRHLRIDLTGGILLMAVFLSTPSIACLLTAVVFVASGLATHRRLWNILFNTATGVLSIGLAAALYNGMADTTALPLDSWRNAGAMFVSGSGHWLVESALVTVLATARNGEPFARNYVANWREVYIPCILLTLLAVLGATSWHQGSQYALLLFLPAVAVYQLLSVNRMKQEQVIKATAIIAEVLDRSNPFTFQHSQRVAGHVSKMAKQLKFSVVEAEVLHRAALIHDIGKLGQEDNSTILPPDKEPTEYQFYNIRQHAQMGAMIAREIPAFEGTEDSIRYHHDWYDGSRVSKEHTGEEIPLGARIIAVADSYDILCMANGEATLVYDPKAVEQLRTMGGRRLDPGLLALFLELLEAEQTGELSYGQLARPTKLVAS